MRKMGHGAIAALALLGAGSASAQTYGPLPGPHSGERASIPFITSNGPRTFRPTPHGEGVYIEDAHRNWYYVRFFNRCNELPSAMGVRFETFGHNPSLDRGDSIVAGYDRCRIADIVRSGAPPERPKKLHRQG